jgi:hypothetical protein
MNLLTLKIGISLFDQTTLPKWLGRYIVKMLKMQIGLNYWITPIE